MFKWLSLFEFQLDYLESRIFGRVQKTAHRYSSTKYVKRITVLTAVNCQLRLKFKKNCSIVPPKLCLSVYCLTYKLSIDRLICYDPFFGIPFNSSRIIDQEPMPHIRYDTIRCAGIKSAFKSRPRSLLNMT